MCDDGTGNHEMVANPRRAQLQSALERLGPDLETLRTVFDDAERAMSAGAWTGRPATSFGDSLSGRARAASRAAQQAEGHLTDEIASEPEQVRRCETLPGSTFPFSFPCRARGADRGHGVRGHRGDA